jgi:hypothetical protein
MKKIVGLLSVCLLAAGAAQAAIIYQDNFDNDTLATNTNGIGGGMVNRTIGTLAWSDDGDLSRSGTGSATYTRRAIAYSQTGFQSDGGFELSVNYKIDTSTGLGTAGTTLSFGLISEDTTFSAYSGYNTFGVDTNVYSIGANVYGYGDTGLNFTDGSTVSTVDAATFTLNAETTVFMSIVSDGSGGADWSWSIGGVDQGNGNIGTFDFSKTYHFVAYGQDDQYIVDINSVTLSAIPEPATIGMVGLGALITLLIRRWQRS